MAKQMILYRGSLKSCNYRCSYCPFSKHRSPESELALDKSQWARFCGSLAERAGKRGGNQTNADGNVWQETGAVMVTPYGEALIHPWYWEGLAAVSSLESIDAVGAQTNLSFDPEEALRRFDQAGGSRDKLRLWASFHPEMVSVSHFSQQCQRIAQAGIKVCAGAVGVPQNLGMIRQLKASLPEDIYLWINRMDGLKRPYTRREQEAFQSIDPFFSQELAHRKAMPSKCLDRLFAEGDGTLRICNISRPLKSNWYDCAQTCVVGKAPAGTGALAASAVPAGTGALAASAAPAGAGALAASAALACGRSACSCYLAYGGRRDFEHRLAFGRYPLFRIPWKPKAYFLDIDGTLIPKAPFRASASSSGLLHQLKTLSEQGPLFLATSLPYGDAARKCRGFFGLFSGGVFAGGAHIVLTQNHKRSDTFLPLDNKLTEALSDLSRSAAALLPFKFHIHLYRSNDIVYKATLEKPSRRPWRSAETASVLTLLSGCPFYAFTEENCLQVTAPEADKGAGVVKICRLLGINPQDTLSAGDSREDISMFSVCGFGIAAPGSPPEVCRAADMG